MAVGDELSVYVDLLKQGRTSLRLKAEAIARQRDGDSETVVAEGSSPSLRSTRTTSRGRSRQSEESNG